MVGKERSGFELLLPILEVMPGNLRNVLPERDILKVDRPPRYRSSHHAKCYGQHSIARQMRRETRVRSRR